MPKMLRSSRVKPAPCLVSSHSGWMSGPAHLVELHGQRIRQQPTARLTLGVFKSALPGRQL